MAYVAAVLANMGNYASFGDTKLVPGCSTDELHAVLSAAAKTSGSEKRLFAAAWTEETLRLAFDLSPRLRQLGIGARSGVSTYFSSNCEEADAALAQRYLDSRKLGAYNTRLFKGKQDGARTALAKSNVDTYDFRAGDRF